MATGMGTPVTQLDHVAGTVKVLPQVWSPERNNARDIYVYLPPSYASSDRHYPVIYMQDGQNLFDPSLSCGAEWQVDEHMERLSGLGLEAIIVGIPNAGSARLDEYSPFADAEHGGGAANQFLDFMTQTLKPRIDSEFRTHASRDFTGIAGSSMGALLSLYAFFTRGEVFGFAGVMSPAFWFANGQVFTTVKEAPFIPGRVYLDVGTGEGEKTVSDTRRMHELLLEKGYRPGETMMYVEDDDADHSEAAWGRRVRTALYYLIPVP
jgi:predicted alpha/beta superfamily hydrolase